MFRHAVKIGYVIGLKILLPLLRFFLANLFGPPFVLLNFHFHIIRQFWVGFF